MVHNIYTSRELHLKFKIPMRTIQKYAKHVRDEIHVPLYETGGAPRVFDKQSCDIIKTMCSDQHYALGDLAYKELLAEQAILSARRRDAGWEKINSGPNCPWAPSGPRPQTDLFLFFLLFFSRPAVTNRKKQKRQTRQKQNIKTTK